jgi:methanethiol S-methyltransferase
VLSAVTLRRSFDPLGLAPSRAHLHGRAARPEAFVVRGPYRWVRHPLYSCILVLFWTNPEITADRLLLSLLWTAWILVGAVLEERDLIAEFREPYRAYRQRVPMFIPWRGRVQATEAFEPALGQTRLRL